MTNQMKMHAQKVGLQTIGKITTWEDTNVQNRPNQGLKECNLTHSACLESVLIGHTLVTEPMTVLMVQMKYAIHMVIVIYHIVMFLRVSLMPCPFTLSPYVMVWPSVTMERMNTSTIAVRLL